jgi:hypothetical protein
MEMYYTFYHYFFGDFDGIVGDFDGIVGDLLLLCFLLFVFFLSSLFNSLNPKNINPPKIATKIITYTN